MNELVNNSLGGIVMLFIIVLFLAYLLWAKDVQMWHRWLFRAMCLIATISVLVHTARLFYVF